MRTWSVALLATALSVLRLMAATPAPAVVFDDGPEGGLPGSTLSVGRIGGSYDAMSNGDAAKVAVLGDGGTVPIVTDAPFSGSSCLRISILASQASWWEAELPISGLAGTEWLRRGSLTLAVRGKAGGESLEVGLTDGGFPSHAVRIPLARYGAIGTSWTLYRIALADFTNLMPELDLDHLATVVIFSARPAPLVVDVDRVAFEPPGTTGPSWVVPPSTARTTPAVAVPTAPPTITPPVAPPSNPVTPPSVPPTVATPPAHISSGSGNLELGPEPTTTQEPEPVAVASGGPMPTMPGAPTVAAGGDTPITPAAPTPPTTPPTPTTPGATTPPSVPIRVVGTTGTTTSPTSKPGRIPTGGRPATAPTPPDGPVVRPNPPGAPPTVPGPPPSSPLVGTPPETGDSRPMQAVSIYLADAPAGSYAGSELLATWATNHGERQFETEELKESFGVVDGKRLPLVNAEGRPGTALKLEVKQSGFAWWLARVAREAGPGDETLWLRNGRLELAIKGAVGGEVVRIGLQDGQGTPEMVLVPINRYATVSTEWQVVRVPLRALRVENPHLDWTKIAAFVVASGNGKPLTVYVADVRIVNPPSQ